MVIKSFIGATCACLAAVSFNASAAIISVDWNKAGDNLITQDTVTGLEWLDLTATTSRSYNDISAKFGAGQEFDGWRYATRSEISGFFDAFGGDSTYYMSGWSVQNNGLFDEVSALWGDTYCALVINACADGEGSSFYVTSSKGSGGTHYYGSIQDPATDIRSIENDWVRIAQTSFTDTTAIDTFGAALVRETVVPVPAAVWLFGSGLLGLIGIARRKKA